jgi:hypothetical protein|tara:strand:+ start:100 stop:396 length:297 start_codon:yes stop_codon:yes gene_type:complete
MKKVEDEVLEDNFTEGVYNHDAFTSDGDACGFSQTGFNEKNGTMNGIVSGIDGNKNFVSQLAERLEASFTPREIVFMAAKLSYINMVKEFAAKQKEQE